MRQQNRKRVEAAAEHDQFFDLVILKLRTASDESMALGRTFRLDSGAREGAHLGAILRFVAEYAEANDYEPGLVRKQLKDAMEALADELDEEDDDDAEDVLEDDGEDEDDEPDED